VLYNTKLVSFGNGVAVTNNGEIAYSDIVLAIGHSARDTYAYLMDKGFAIESKPFSVGVRVEHLQSDINEAMYGKYAEALGPASYKIAHRENNRGVYSFCMCPGGFVVPAASGPRQLVVNGMSPSTRGSRWANSGMVVEIRPEDYMYMMKGVPNQERIEPNSPLALMALQERLEEDCWINGAMKQTAPAQRMCDFIQNKQSFNLPESSYTPGLTSSMLATWMPEFIASRLRDGFQYFGKISKGFMTNEALMIAMETRTSSPVRILRDKESYQHITLKGLFPCGEGAGYAGGIVSAAIDGERCAEGVANLLFGSITV
jgi:uncharacterized FAD-dependent dehydrogenase